MLTAPRKIPHAPTGAKRAAISPRAARTPRGPHYHVYVIELADAVWNVGRFRRANPDYQLGRPFVYVGMTGHSGQRDAVRRPRLPRWADEGWALRSCQRPVK